VSSLSLSLLLAYRPPESLKFSRIAPSSTTLRLETSLSERSTPQMVLLLATDRDTHHSRATVRLYLYLNLYLQLRM
jgi:hypothetical protein